MPREIIVADDVKDQARRAATLIVERARAAIAERGRFVMALSGGSTVRAVYERLADAQGIDWPRVFFLWGDERFVDLNNPYSNYRLAEEALLSRLPGLPRENVFPVDVGAFSPTEGARRYAQTLAGFFALKDGEWPRLDLTLNGMGPDGHTASLFPHRSTVTIRDRLAAMSHAGHAPWVDRVTLTLPVFNHARCVLFLAAGRGKAAMLRQVLEGPRNLKHWPAGAVDPVDGELIWLIEPEIASLLSLPGQSGHA